MAQAGVACEERVFSQAEEGGDAEHVMVLQAHITRPFAAGGTTLADVEHVRVELNVGVGWAAVIV